jgi:hypothetical protein
MMMGWNSHSHGQEVNRSGLTKQWHNTDGGRYNSEIESLTPTHKGLPPKAKDKAAEQQTKNINPKKLDLWG